MRNVFILLLSALAACMPLHKALKTLDKNNAWPEECAKRFPHVDSTDTVSIEIPYEDTGRLSALNQYISHLEKRLDYLEGLPYELDSADYKKVVALYIRDLKFYKAEMTKLKDSLQASTVRIKEIRTLREHTAKLEAERKKWKEMEASYTKLVSWQEKQMDILEKDNKKLKSSVSDWRGYAISAWIIILVTLIIVFRKQLAGLFGGVFGFVGSILKKISVWR